MEMCATLRGGIEAKPGESGCWVSLELPGIGSSKWHGPGCGGYLTAVTVTPL